MVTYLSVDKKSHPDHGRVKRRDGSSIARSHCWPDYRGRMSVIAVPYFLDEFLPDLDLVLRPDQVITATVPQAGACERLAAVCEPVARAVAGASRNGGRPVVSCGECCAALGILAGLQAARGAVAIVWFDAHGDVQTPETTTSGFLGGMALRLLTGYRPELIAARLWLRPVPEEHIVLVGARDLDPPEVSYLNEAPIVRRDVADLAAGDLPDMPLYVHVDLDVLDPAHVPGLRYPAPGGPAPDQLVQSLRMLLATGRVAAVGLACTWHPGHGAASRIEPMLEPIFQ